MDGGLLSLKWNNHRSTFFYVLSNVRKKECYTDVTLACDGKFYPVHKLVLSTCSEYFEQMFEQTQCKHPVIVLKDIRSEELESLLSYMYVGEVNVVQEKLSGLIKAAECLRIKGLAVPDEEPCSKTSTSREKRSSDNSLNSEPKRRRQDDSGNTSSFRQAHSNNRNDDRRKSLDHPSSSTSNKFRNTNSSNNNNVNSNRPSSGDRESGDRGTTSSRAERLASPASNNQHSAAEVKTEELAETSEAEAPDEVTIDEPNEPVKQEPVDLDAVYLSDSNSATEAKDILMDNFGDSDGQQHFMDELLGQNSGSDQGNMGVGDYSEGGEGSSSAPSGAGGQQQQHMVPSTMEQPQRQGSLLLLQRPLRQHQQQPLSLPQHQQSQQRWRTHPTPNVRLALASDPMSVALDSFLSHSDTDVGAYLPPASSGATASSNTRPSSSSTSSSALMLFQCDAPGVQEQLSPNPSLVPVSQLDLDSLMVGAKSYRCPVCEREVRERADFVRHYMTHTGEKPFCCDFCPYKAGRRFTLMRHVKTLHPEKFFPSNFL